MHGDTVDAIIARLWNRTSTQSPRLRVEIFFRSEHPKRFRRFSRLKATRTSAHGAVIRTSPIERPFHSKPQPNFAHENFDKDARNSGRALSLHRISGFAGVDNFFGLCSGPGQAVDVPQEWRQQREAKSKSLKPYQTGSLEAGTLYVQKEKLLEPFTEGWKGLHPKLGGLSTGSGFAGGMRYVAQIAEGRVNFQTSGAISPACVSSTISSGARPSCWVTSCSPNSIRVTGVTRRRISMGLVRLPANRIEPI